MYYMAIFPPLFGAFIVGLFGRFLGNRLSNFVTCVLMGLACLSAWFVFVDIGLQGNELRLPLFTWIDVGDLVVNWSLQYNPLTVTMVAVVTTVSFLVHVYSIGYMAHDDSIPRFMAYLSLFTFAMLMLVTADNMFQLFFGWEGVGVCSYLLIGFWYEKPSANAAAIKAFVVNRVGDLGLVLGIGALYFIFGTVEINPILQAIPDHTDVVFSFMGHSFNALEVTGLLLFIGAMGKSAQIGLHTWLPDAMEGPTPVSALIHAATMVTAGVFLVVRFSPLYDVTPFARDVITFVGATTALFAGTVALTQNDIKRVIAYSTCSQLGYMFFATGLGAYGIAIFHLVTHAFFKALLFLGSGAVIHAMSDEQDMRNMGGIWRLIPTTYTLMWIGSLALAGIPFFAGYYSKDAILASAWLSGTSMGGYAYVLGIGAAFLTALYSWRLLFMTFTGKARADERVMSHVHEPGVSMQLPLFVLAFGALFSGFIGNPYFLDADFWGNSLVFRDVAMAHLPFVIHYLPAFVGGIGVLVAYYFYVRKTKLPKLLAKRFQGLYAFSLHKWYFDELYDRIFVRSTLSTGAHLWEKGDEKTIDAYGPNGVADLTIKLSNRTSQMQTGYVYHYAFVMILGMVLLLFWFIFVRS